MSQSFAIKISRMKILQMEIDCENLKNYIPQKFVHTIYCKSFKVEKFHGFHELIGTAKLFQ